MMKLLLLAAFVHVAILKVQGQANLKPMAVYPLNKKVGTKDILGKNPPGISKNIGFSAGPYGGPDNAIEFKGRANSYVEFPNKGGLDAKKSITLCAWINNENDGPIFNYATNHWGVHLWMIHKNNLFVRFTHNIVSKKLKYVFTTSLGAKVKRLDSGWHFGCASYDGKTGKARLFVNNAYDTKSEKNIGKNLRLSTQDDVRMGVRIGDARYLKGSVSCMQVYGAALTEEQIKKYAKKRCLTHTKVEHELTCGSNQMKVTVKRPTPYTSFKDLRLLDPACKAGKNFQFKFGLDKCGTQVETTKTEIIYRNEILGTEIVKGGKVSRVKDIRITLECAYPRKTVLTSNKIEPNQDKFRGASVENGKFKFAIKMFPTKKFDKPFAKYPARLHLRQPVYVQVSVNSLSGELAILAKDCYATATKSPADKLRHPLIANSCPADKTLKMLPSPSTNKQRFRLQTFRFVEKKHKYIFIHCMVTTCDGKKKDSVCAKGCQKPKVGKREESDLEGLETFSLSQGPFALKHPESQVAVNLEQDSNQLDDSVSMPLEISD